jgi:hypothetical protein
MIIKYFDEQIGEWYDITGTNSQSLQYDAAASGWVTTSKNAYKSFVGEFSQVGSSDPTFVTFFNDTGATFTITRQGTGHYRLESDISIFVKTEMWWYIGNNQLTQADYLYQVFYESSTIMSIYSYKGGALNDDALEHTSFEFRKY